MNLGKRLAAVVNEVDGRRLADIGCDHGKVSVECLLTGKVDKVIACDISQLSLNKAIELAKKYNVAGVEFRAGDGLKVIQDGEVDCVVIAGMGGKEMISILSYLPQGIKSLVLSPHKNVIELREFLSGNGIYIDKDYIVRDGKKFYDVIVAKIDAGKDCKLDRRQLLLGKNQSGKDFEEYVALLRQKQAELLQKSAESKQAKLYGEMLNLV